MTDRLLLPVFTLVLALLCSGCNTTATGSPVTDIDGGAIPPGLRLTGERYDDRGALQRARNVVVVPFTVDPMATDGYEHRVLRSGAIMASEEVVTGILKNTDVEWAGFGDGTEPADLVITGRMVGYVRPSKSTDVLIGGKQRIEYVGEVRAGPGGKIVAAFFVRVNTKARKWWQNEEKDVQKLSRASGKNIGKALADNMN